MPRAEDRGGFWPRKMQFVVFLVCHVLHESDILSRVPTKLWSKLCTATYVLVNWMKLSNCVGKHISRGVQPVYEALHFSRGEHLVCQVI